MGSDTRVAQACTNRARCDTIVVTMIIEPVRTVKARFSEFLDLVERDHEEVLITRNGRAAAVMISYEQLESMRETMAILSEPGALDEILQAEKDLAAGVPGIPLEDVIDEIKSRHRGA
ncbi:MAG: type II toxin-antitoxin system Phd/YefM family antitoxin [Actinobacteria bacterium]|nr:type II toxin-antitoxin system Phd/YefM family antitoxin [Actinomycetota bacterium]